jgi:TonB-linked SusC/RagA family outer membrane protein
MKKNNKLLKEILQSYCYQKILRIMKLAILLFFIVICQVFTNVTYSQVSKLTSNLGEIELKANLQPITITGTVTDENGESMPGVAVRVKGTTIATSTDMDGRFTIKIDNPDAILEFSFIGYLTQEIAVGNQTEMNVAMEIDLYGLGTVVVTGYGIQKKVNLSGAVDQVDATEFKSRPITNISQGLQGMVPNLNIDFISGEPGKAADINIRGITSINEGEPLILIDGVPSDAMELNRLSPEDIQTISILKDASSAAIYGARAAFGVVLITTKAGLQEGIHIGYDNNFSWSRPTILPHKILDPYIYMRLQETSTDNTPWDSYNYSDETYLWAKQRSEDPSVPGVRIDPNDPTSWEYMGGHIDWTEYFLNKYAFSQMHHLTVEGRSAKTAYYLSGSYNSQSGAIKLAEDVFDRYNLRSNVNYSPFDWLNIGNNTILTVTERAKPYYLSLWDIYNVETINWDKNPDGTWANSYVGQTAARITEGGKISDKYNSFQTTVTGEASFWKRMLRINADATFKKGDTNYNSYETKYKIGYGPGDVREEGNNRAYRSTTFTNYYVFNIYGTFDKLFGRHQVSAIAGYNQEFSRSEWLMAQKDKVVSASLPTIQLATGDAYVGESIADWAIRGMFFRVNYIFNEKYILEFNGRYDGSSKFPTDHRYGFFPSASAAWRVDKESFMAPLENVISMFKLRASYGSLGNQYVTEYGYIPAMTAQTGYYIIGGSLPQMVSAPPLVSSNYTWEKVTSGNFGFDLGVLNNSLTAIFDIYQRNTKGMLTQGKDLPDVLGAAEPLENAADLKTNGWEVSLTYKNKIMLAGKALMFNTRFILSDSRSWITSFDNPNKNLIQYYKGQKLGEIWGLKSDGLFQTTEEIAQLDESSIIPWGALSIVPGWPKYKDLDHNGIIEKGLTVDDPKDLSVIGNLLPRFRYGLNLDFTWNGFDFRIFFQGIGKRDYYPLDYLYWGFYQQPYYGGYKHLFDFYRPTDDTEIQRAKHSQSYIDAGLADQNLDAKYPILQAWLADRNLGERIDEAMGLAIPQTRYMLNGAYLRLKNLTIGYTLPSSVTGKIHITNLRIFISGENLTEWSELANYYDPESITESKVKINPGLSAGREVGTGYSYPFSRLYSFGLNATF